MASSRRPPTLVVLPREKSVLNWPGPCMMLCPVGPYPVEPSDPTTAGAQIARVSIHWFSFEPALPGLTRLADDAPGQSVTVEVPAWPYTPPPLGSVRGNGSPLWMMTMPASVQPFSIAPCAAEGSR